MNLNGAGPPGPQLVKKLEDIEDRGGPGGKDIKPVKTTLNRVPRSSFLPSLLALTLTVAFSRCLRAYSITRTFLALALTPVIGTECLQKAKDAMRGG
jgi:hypothetical protein